MTGHSIIIFSSGSAAFKAEKILVKAGIECKLVPPPREFSSDCGVAVRINSADTEKAEELLLNKKVDIQGIHPL